MRLELERKFYYLLETTGLLLEIYRIAKVFEMKFVVQHQPSVAQNGHEEFPPLLNAGSNQSLPSPLLRNI